MSSSHGILGGFHHVMSGKRAEHGSSGWNPSDPVGKDFPNPFGNEEKLGFGDKVMGGIDRMKNKLG